MTRCLLYLFLVLLTSLRCSGRELATGSDLRQIFGREKFTLLYHVREISEHDWTAAGIHPCHGAHIRDSIVDPGHAWASEDYMVGPCQLFLGAKNPRYEIL